MPFDRQRGSSGPLWGWHVVGRSKDLASANTVTPVILGPGVVDEPLVVVSDDQRQLRGLSNVCTHRGHLLVDEPTKDAAMLRCSYHGRCFNHEPKAIQ
ncbi:MAG: Rieske 2Fe-2S domain-containing protein [Myxococcota bacterium]